MCAINSDSGRIISLVENAIHISSLQAPRINAAVPSSVSHDNTGRMNGMPLTSADSHQPLQSLKLDSFQLLS